VVVGTVIVPLKVTEAGGAVREIVVLADTGVPPPLLHASAYVVAAEIGPTCSVPEGAREPVHPLEAVQLVAFVEDHVSVAVPPGATVVGVDDNVTVGVGVGGGLLPPPPPPPPPPQLATKIAHAMMGSRASVRVMIDSILATRLAAIPLYKRKTGAKNDTVGEK
jgi:hypothetical protein